MRENCIHEWCFLNGMAVGIPFTEIPLTERLKHVRVRGECKYIIIRNAPLTHNTETQQRWITWDHNPKWLFCAPTVSKSCTSHCLLALCGLFRIIKLVSLALLCNFYLLTCYIAFSYPSVSPSYYHNKGRNNMMPEVMHEKVWWIFCTYQNVMNRNQ